MSLRILMHVGSIATPFLKIYVNLKWIEFGDGDTGLDLGMGYR